MSVDAALAAAEAGTGPTVFAWLLETFERHPKIALILDDEDPDAARLMEFYEGLDPLMRSKTLPQALEYVAAFIEREERETIHESTERLAHLHSTRGSILMALGRNDEALEAYRLSEVLDPSIQAKLTVASHLLYSHRELQREALVKAEEALALTSREADGTCWRGWARGLRGVALLQLGRVEEAREAWIGITSAVASATGRIEDCDLLLAEALIDARLWLPEVTAYLRTVAEKAASTSSHDLPQRCARAQTKLDALRTSPITQQVFLIGSLEGGRRTDISSSC